MATTSYLLLQDSFKCNDCGMCTLLLPKFLDEYKGKLIVTEANLYSDHIRNVITDIIDNCPNDAITLEVQKDNEAWGISIQLKTRKQGIFFL